MNKRIISIKLIKKLGISFLLILLLVGVTYVLISLFFSNKFHEEATQKLNANIANHLIEEKFKSDSPFLEDGSVNKPLFGDIMHDMMAVNRGIEVYLLNETGEILYSVVLDHSNPKEPVNKIDLAPVSEFIKKSGNVYILGDDPRNKGEKKIFSAAHYKEDNHQGYIYIILAGEASQTINQSLFSSYIPKLATEIRGL